LFLLGLLALANLSGAAESPSLETAAQELLRRLAGDADFSQLVAPLATEEVLANSRQNLGAIRQALRTQAWGLVIQAACADGDCGVVVFAGVPGSQPPPTSYGTLFLIRTGDSWRLLPNASDYARFNQPLSEDQRHRFADLSVWAKERIPAVPARWQQGPGLVGTAPAEAGMTIPFGVTLTGGYLPARIALSEEQQDDGMALVIRLLQGAIQVEVHGLGTYRRVRVRGASLDVELSGTLFVVLNGQIIETCHHADFIDGTAFLVQRRGDRDYVALIDGHLQVRAPAGFDPNAIRVVGLLPRQGFGGFDEHGLGGVDQLLNRPQLIADIALRDQGLADAKAYAQMAGHAAGDASWSYNAAAVAIERSASQPSQAKPGALPAQPGQAGPVKSPGPTRTAATDGPLNLDPMPPGGIEADLVRQAIMDVRVGPLGTHPPQP
jgi:hypothetical protein